MDDTDLLTNFSVGLEDEWKSKFTVDMVTICTWQALFCIVLIGSTPFKLCNSRQKPLSTL